MKTLTGYTKEELGIMRNALTIVDAAANTNRSTLEENATVGTDSTDEELMACYESNRRNGNGEAIGEVGQSPSEAVKSEGWTLVRAILKGTNCPGTPVLAKDAADRIWVVNDLDGPWAIQVAEND